MQPIARAPRTSRVLSIALAGVLAVGTAACSGGDGESSAPTSTDAATTTAASTTSTSSTSTTSTVAPTTTEAITTTTEPPVPVYPLTGLVMTDPFIGALPALVVKIDNAPGARPQSGMNEADIVVEEIVNDNLTRFAFVFQSQGADPVGPIRSGRCWLRRCTRPGPSRKPSCPNTGATSSKSSAVRLPPSPPPTAP